MKIQNKPGIGLGALAGLLLTAPLLAVFYLGWRLAGLPFAPFGVFDWATQKLPGGLITFGIDTMVRMIRSLHLGGTAAVAKRAEQALAVIGFLVAGIIVGSIFFGIMRFSRRKPGLLAGLVLGILVGIPILLVNRSSEQAANPIVGRIWIMVIFLAWGVALAWVYRRFTLEAALPAGSVEGLAATSTQASMPAASDVQQLSIQQVDRRQFILRLGGATAIITVVGATLARSLGKGPGREAAPAQGELWSSHHPLPNADAAVKPAPGTRPELTPVAQHYRIDINTAPPVIQEDSWRLNISGLVEQPLALTLEDIRRGNPMHQFVTLACISNPVGGDLIGTTRWTGLSMQHLLPQLKLRPNATHLKIHAADGFYEIVPLDTIRTDERVMLAYAWDGVPLTAEHGFPLRIYIPNHYGMKQPKWIKSMEAIDHWEEGYWVTRGWDKEAIMKATSVIDTIAEDMMIIEANANTRVPIGGIAHAGARGISKVEVRMDDGPWEAAQLRTPLSGLTWVIWRYDWSFQKGKHIFTVRCTDGQGVPQITEEAPPHPSGASGLNTRSAMV